jgi:hypothetical protein
MSETSYEYLDDRDKNNIIINHIRNLEYNMYNLEVSLALAGSDAESSTALNAEIEENKTKIATLKTKLIAVS